MTFSELSNQVDPQDKMLHSKTGNSQPNPNSTLAIMNVEEKNAQFLSVSNRKLQSGASEGTGVPEWQKY